jgi:hypothetical protein
MNTKVTNYTEAIKHLADWIDSLREAAKDDTSFSISYFEDTEKFPLSIVGGWQSGYSAAYNDLLYISKSNPEYAMCVKIAINRGADFGLDFEEADMPIDDEEEIEDTCIALELEDDSEALAVWLFGEWEALMNCIVEEV